MTIGYHPLLKVAGRWRGTGRVVGARRGERGRGDGREVVRGGLGLPLRVGLRRGARTPVTLDWV